MREDAKDQELSVIMTRTSRYQPLATVRNLPGGDADLTPAQLRALAAALNRAADECEKRPMGKGFIRTVRTYSLLERGQI